MQRSTEEIQEIERHKYFMSEKRGYDVGWETAEEDWERNYGQRWRAGGQVEDENGESPVEARASIRLAEATSDVEPTARHGRGQPDSERMVRLADGPSEPEPSRGFRSWLTRWFAK